MMPVGPAVCRWLYTYAYIYKLLSKSDLITKIWPSLLISHFAFEARNYALRTKNSAVSAA